jgi:hypothetical protein
MYQKRVIIYKKMGKGYVSMFKNEKINLNNVCVEIATSKCLSFIIKTIKAPIRIFVSDLHPQATLALS